MDLKLELKGVRYSKKVVIVDYQLGNLFSVQHACKKIGIMAEVSSDVKVINEADALILPGVGAFGDAMKNVLELNLIEPIKNAIASGKPFFGICLGMQLLFDSSEEFGNYKGLGIIPGAIRKFPMEFQGLSLRVPQISWNKVFLSDSLNEWTDTPLSTTVINEYMYFVHSYYVMPESEEHVLCKTDYNGFQYCSGVNVKNVFAVQFHPEKSGEKGLQVYRNWANQNLI
ncbi:imidazole glycerol phosphate synthase subunit HisH [uncultured Roseivirga sp.]|uniref:imidazole glycerol phosphate synthase subunit HisH n=1 Tax=uncultured Roseivirga sp. TaxID=543088 RepID=UPI0030D87774|tara:strand:+ start:1066 stop:1749 length:684 start_codon:yes stop_codon:yes gene_type:complete